MTTLEPQARTMDAAIGTRVHMLMWERRITQQDLGAAIGMDQSSLGKRLRGDRGWTADQVMSVARALSTTVAYLFGEIDDPKCTPRDLNPEPTDSGSLWELQVLCPHCRELHSIESPCRLDPVVAESTIPTLDEWAAWNPVGARSLGLIPASILRQPSVDSEIDGTTNPGRWA